MNASNTLNPVAAFVRAMVTPGMTATLASVTTQETVAVVTGAQEYGLAAIIITTSQIAKSF